MTSSPANALPLLVRMENALGAALLRADLLGAPRPVIDERYEVRALLGRGARGVVIHVHDTRLGRELAIKLVPEALTSEAALAEARALAKLEHPNVVRVYDCDVTTVTFDEQDFAVSYVCMQLVRGPTLRSWLTLETRSTEQILAVFEAVGQGLQAAHDAGLVHRDMKPENVVIASEQDVKVIDFGFASPGEAGSSGTAGTRAYLAPEVGRGVQTAASDQYAFAIALEEALGERDLPDHVTNALTRARSREPVKRHPSMRALLTALRGGRTKRYVAGALGVLALALVLTGAALMKGDEDTVTREEARICHAAEGVFSFTGHVTDAVPDVNHERWSAYRVRIRERAPCRFSLEVTKYTDDRATGFYDWRGTLDDVPGVVREGGRLDVASQLTLDRPNRTEPYEHAFAFTLEGERLTGTFDVLDRRDGFERVYGGRLVGRRDLATQRPAR